MAKTVQFRGGTTTQHSTFTGANREITIDTDKHVPVVHDGVTPGGYPLALASASVKPDTLTTTQAKDAIYAAHLSKDAIEKINGLQSSASEIDGAVANNLIHRKQEVLTSAGDFKLTDFVHTLIRVLE